MVFTSSWGHLEPQLTLKAATPMISSDIHFFWIFVFLSFCLSIFLSFGHSLDFSFLDFVNLNFGIAPFCAILLKTDQCGGGGCSVKCN